MKKLCMLITLLQLSGCSVFMAAKASDVPDMSTVHVGATRAEIQSALGRPISTIREHNGSVATYQYFTGDEANYKRAATYALLDGVTLGLAELVTAPAEMLQGDKHTVTVRYEPTGRALDIKETIHAAPLDTPEKVIGIRDAQEASRETTKVPRS